jgi:hypothetical protein
MPRAEVPTPLLLARSRWDVSDIEEKAFKEFRKTHGLAN